MGYPVTPQVSVIPCMAPQNDDDDNSVNNNDNNVVLQTSPLVSDVSEEEFPVHSWQEQGGGVAARCQAFVRKTVAACDLPQRSFIQAMEAWSKLLVLGLRLSTLSWQPK